MEKPKALRMVYPMAARWADWMVDKMVGLKVF
jgi:hypothetical protein